ncbi:MAG: ATP-binding cassette domain-containing protein [Bacteroidetes bacterium]|nr:MAG: ATP-binding cassette domain-containing protein [Bacteroidota bacterium]
MQLFALIAKQDVGISEKERNFVENFLKQQLNESTVKEYLALFDGFISSDREKNSENTIESGEHRLTSVKDSVKTLGIAKKINRTLTQKQKIVVLVRLFELINSDKNFTPQRMAMIDTAADVFNITREEQLAISTFVIQNDSNKADIPEILIIGCKNAFLEHSHFIHSPQLDGKIFILRIKSVDLYFLKYKGDDEVLLNGLPVKSNRVYLFANGSVIKPAKGKPVFYTDVAARFITDPTGLHITLRAENIYLTFPNGTVGLQDINLEETTGKMMAIMGSSGSGKTTLLNILSGIQTPARGNVFVNGKDLYEQKDLIKGIIGYIPQDDLLIEELTVWENLYYSTKLVYKNLSSEQITEKLEKVLISLGLFHIKDLKVGNPLDKRISGGQRKRLNIGLELIREPSVLFVDEPTSGLSSRDSENVMELLKELTIKGKLVFVVIHQPSSEIFKMFDKVLILDEGGYQIYYGNPVEAPIYFKRIDNQINSDIGECPRCGNVNPESIFSIVESQIVDEYGRSTGKRKVQPWEWANFFKKTQKTELIKESFRELPDTSAKPGWLKQISVFFGRDLKSKLSNRQYILLNLFEAPVLAMLLAFVIRYIEDPSSGSYIFRENDNIMPYLFMCTIVALFIGLIVSAEEIFKDRKILKRESFLNLSRSSYLYSKVSILFIISAIQALLFVWVGNSILEIEGMFFEYWLVFFSVAAFANVLGLNISSAFNSAVTIYILIPFLIIPQMVLTGAMFSFDKINRGLGGGSEKVPVIAEIMPSRWAFEALAVNQFVNNEYEKQFYTMRQLESVFNYKNVYYIPELKGIIEQYISNTNRAEKFPIDPLDIELLYHEVQKENNSEYVSFHNIVFNDSDKLNINDFNLEVANDLKLYLDDLHEFYRQNFNSINRRIDNLISEKTSSPEGRQSYQSIYDMHYNTYLARFAKNTMAPLPMVRLNNKLIQKIDPIYLNPQNNSYLDFRAHFLAPVKNFMGGQVPTLYFNVGVIWIFTILAFATLYFNALKRLVDYFEEYSILKRKNNKN